MRPYYCVWFFLIGLIFISCESQNATDLTAERPVMVDSAPSRFIDLSTKLLPELEGQKLVRVLLSRQRAFSYLRQEDSVLSTGVKIRIAAEDPGDSLAMAKSLLLIRGTLSREQQQLFEPYLPGALRTFRRERMRYEEGVILSLMGYLETRKGNVQQAVNHLQAARKILEPMDSARALYPVMLNLGNGYSALGQFEEAEMFSRRSFEYAATMKDSVRMAMSLQNLAILFQSKNQSDSTIAYLKKSASYVPESAGAFLPLQLSYNLADAYRVAGNHEEAEKNYRKVLQAFQAFGSTEGVAMAHRGLALVAGDKGWMDEAVNLMERSMRELDSAGNGLQKQEQYGELVALYKKAGRTGEALDAMTRQKHLSDSLFSVEKSLSVKELEFRYQTEKKEEENKLLRQQVRLRNFYMLGLLVLLSLSLVIMVIIRQRNRYLRELNRTNARLVDKYLQERDRNSEPERKKISVSPKASADLPDLEDEKLVNEDKSKDNLEMYHRITSLFEDQKIHLDQALRAEDLANRVGISPRKMTAVLKEQERTFSQLLNQFRVAEASRLLEDPSHSMYNLEGIASKSGFTNRQHFRRVFEQVTGVNPGFYRSMMNKKGYSEESARENEEEIV